MDDKYGYIGIETLLNFCENSKDHAVTPNDFMRMKRVRLPSAQPDTTAPTTGTTADTISRQAAIDKWKNDFKGYVNALNIPRDDYKGIMAYIDELPSTQPKQLETCPLYGGVCGYPSDKCYECQRHPEKPNHGYMWICPECGLPVHSDFEKCPRCGWNRQPETVARDIAKILENEQDMRVILKNAEDETVVARCEVKENADLIAQIMDCDVDGEAFLTRCQDCKHYEWDDINECYCCYKWGYEFPEPDEFCSRAERKDQP